MHSRKFVPLGLSYPHDMIGGDVGATGIMAGRHVGSGCTGNYPK